jgi:hypothetical protein
VRGGYELLIDATGSRTGAAQGQPTVAVEVYGPDGNMVGERMTLDESRTARVTCRGGRRALPHPRVRLDAGRSRRRQPQRYEGEATCETTINPCGAVPDGARRVLLRRHLRQGPPRARDRRRRGPACCRRSSASARRSRASSSATRTGFENNWEIAPAIGVALSLVGSDKVREHALFIDVAANRYFENNAYIGTGVSFWDLTRSDTFSPAWLVGFGVPLNQRRAVCRCSSSARAGCSSATWTAGVADNYQFWGGMRVHFPRQ